MLLLTLTNTNISHPEFYGIFTLLKHSLAKAEHFLLTYCGKIQHLLIALIGWLLYYANLKKRVFHVQQCQHTFNLQGKQNVCLTLFHFELFLQHGLNFLYLFC